MTTIHNLRERQYRTVAVNTLRFTVYAVGGFGLVFGGLLIWAFAYVGLYEVFHNAGVFEETPTAFLFTYAFGVPPMALFGAIAAVAIRAFGTRVALWKGAALGAAGYTVAAAVEFAVTGGF